MHNKFRWHKAIAPIAAFLLVAGAVVYAQEGAQVRQGWPEQIAVQAPAQAAGASWQDSDLRAFLNGENNAGGEQTLLGTQFSPEEQNAIVVSQVDTEGQVTQDKLFLLSAQEAETQALGFIGNASRAAQDGTQTEDWWWLRTPGYDGNDAANVYYDGSIDPDGYPTAYAGGGLRPAMYLDCNQIAYSFHASEFGEVAPQEDGWKVFLKGEQTFSAQAATTDGQSVQLKAALPDGYDKIYVVLLDENENKLGVQKAAVQDGETIAAAVTPETKNIPLKKVFANRHSFFEKQWYNEISTYTVFDKNNNELLLPKFLKRRTTYVSNCKFDQQPQCENCAANGPLYCD